MRDRIAFAICAAVGTPCAVALGLLISWLLVGPAWGHTAPKGWSYPMSCCSGQDCNEIPAERVTTEPDGYHINVLPGDHDFITRPTLFVVAYNDRKIKQSPDGEYHLCISPEYRSEAGATTPSRLLCFFAPPPAY